MIISSMISNVVLFLLIYLFAWKKSYTKKMRARRYPITRRSTAIAYAVFIVIFTAGVFLPWVGYMFEYYSLLFVPILSIVMIVASWKISTNMKPLERVLAEADAIEADLK